MSAPSGEKELRILMLEDSAQDAELLERELRDGGIAFQALRVETEETFRTALSDFSPDLILLDHEVQNFNGEAGLALAQAVCSDVPVIFVSGTIGDEEAVELLKKGATDYVLKDRRSRLVPAVQRALSEARKNKARRVLASIVESASDAIVSKTLEGIIMSWNPAAERLFGYTAAEIIGQPITVLIPPNRLHEEATIMGQIRRGEPTQQFETVRRRKNGTEVEVLVTISPVKNAQGQVIGASKILHDITARKAAEAARFEREQEFETLVENAPDIISRYDREFRHIYVNRVVEQVTGLPASAFIGKTHGDLGMPPHLQAEWHTLLKDVFTSGQERETEYDFPSPTGVRSYLSRLVPERAPDGSIRSVLNIARDITGRKQADKALRQSELDQRRLAERLTAAQAVGKVGSWETDLSTLEVTWSDQTHRIFETDPETFHPTHKQFLAIVHPEDREAVDLAFKNSIKKWKDMLDRTPNPAARGKDEGRRGTVECF